MSVRTVRFEVSLTLRAPVLSHASGALDYGVDSAVLRDARGCPALPGTLVKGNLRESWERLADLGGALNRERIAGWLGDKSEKERETDASNDPRRGRLTFDTWWSDEDWQPGSDGRRYRIRVDEDTGAAEEAMLQVIESPYPAGRRVTFKGGILARIAPDGEDELRLWLHRGLSLVPALGAMKGNGFGRLEAVDVAAAQPVPEIEQNADDLARLDRIGLRIRPLEPFCFARPTPGRGNQTETETFIPGGALIAAIARRLEEETGSWPQLRANLDRLHVTHARPAAKGAGQRPIVPPLTIAKIKESFRDLTGEIGGAFRYGEAPIFAIDWKKLDSDEVERALNGNCRSQEPRKTLRLRNEIDRDSSTAKNGVLYSQQIVLPEGYEWLANLDLGRTSDPAACLAELAGLLASPLTHLGKTKAPAEVTLEAPFRPTVPSRRRAAGRAVLVLQSPARLLPADLAAPATNGGERLHQAYGDAWSALSEGSLRLVHAFAHQHLLGGGYWWHRFQRRSGATEYRPQLFTSAGSVFVLDLIDAESAQALLEDWSRRGLPQLDDAPGGEDWRRNPWISPNGYGEILLDPDTELLLGGGAK